MLRTAILLAARNARVKSLVATAPITRGVVARFVAGDSLDDAIRATRGLVRDGLRVSLDHLGEYTTNRGQAEAMTKDHIVLLGRLADEGLVPGAEISVKLSALGQALDHGLALDNARSICSAAVDTGTTVTLDMEDHTTTDSTLEILSKLRPDFPSTGAVIQAYLRRSEGDCRDLATAGSRVRLCKGAYKEPASVAFQTRGEVDRSYVRCLNVLMSGDGYPMVATHDPRLVSIAGALVRRLGRSPNSYEYQMLYGVRPDEQRRLVAAGETVRVYVPYGTEWYSYLMRRLAERPANVAFFLRSVATRS